MRTPFTTLLNLELPLVQAPMAGVSSAAMAVAVDAAGGLGSIAVGALRADAADRAIRAAAGAARLNVNVFAHPRPRRDVTREAAWISRLTPVFAEFGAEPPAALGEIYPCWDDHPALLTVLLDHAPAVVSFHFGLPAPDAVRALKQQGCVLLATVTSAAEARRAEAAGMDVLVAQGFEAGGHRGAFGPGPDRAQATFTLLPQVVAAVSVPVLVAGGIADGAGVARALALGAAGAQLGTVFITCPESAADETYRRAVADPQRTTAMTPVFSGRPARGLVNRFVREFGGAAEAVPDYPVAYDAGKRLAAAARARGSAAFTAMWAGQGPVRDDRPLPAGALIRALGDELRASQP